MLCPKCGCANPEGSVQCASCQTVLRQSVRPGQTVPDYLAWSLIVTVVSSILGVRCCVSLVATAFGVVGIVKSCNANSKKASGDFAGAMEDARSAKTWLLWAVGVWALSLVVVVVAVILYLAGASVLLRNMHRF